MGIFDFIFKRKTETSQKNVSIHDNIKEENVNNEGIEPLEIKNDDIISAEDWYDFPIGTINMKPIKIVGVTYNNEDGVSRQKILKHIDNYEKVYIVQEKDNQYDQYAISVFSKMGKIGYIPKKDNYLLTIILEKKFKYRARIYKKLNEETNIIYSRIFIQFIPIETYQYFECKIVGINTEEKKDTVSDMEVYDEITLIDDTDIDDNYKILVQNSFGDDIGKLKKIDTKKIYNLLYEKKYDMYAYVTQNTYKEFKIGILIWTNEENI